MLKELTSFIEQLEGIADDLESLRELKGLCGSFFVLRGDTVYFVHQSAKDFLLKNMLYEIFPSGVAELHYMIFSKSLVAMSRTLHRDVYSLRTPGFPIDRVQQPDPDPLVAVRYSCIYWVEHLAEWDPRNTTKDRTDLGNGEAVDKFLREKYLYRLEALSLLRGMSEGVLSIVKLEGILQLRSKSVILSYSFEDILIFL